MTRESGLQRELDAAPDEDALASSYLHCGLPTNGVHTNGATPTPELSWCYKEGRGNRDRGELGGSAMSGRRGRDDLGGSAACRDGEVAPL